MPSAPFHFKKFSLQQEGVAHAVGTDGVLLGAWTDVAGARTILDIGTGTGLVALMLAQRSEQAQITAIDIHPDSVICARNNAAGTPWADRVQVLETSFQQFAQTAPQFDLIVSNPPFFSEVTVSPDDARSLGRHTATLPPGEMLAGVARLLSDDGRFCVVLPEKEGRRLCELAVPLGLYHTVMVQVVSRAGKPVERLLLQLERDPGRFRQERLEIYDGAQYSAAYKALTAAFYLK
jgi:tRNA1Val (adenine37-N6)-methyltransferase